MDRRQFLQSAAATAATAAPNPPRPNFLFLIADDLTHNGIRAMGNQEIETPNLDRLAARGCAFTHCFHQGSWSGAVCVPSRTMLNSGLTAFRAQRDFEQTPLWGETLGKAGYETFMAGKWHLSKPALERSFQVHGPVAGGMFESGPEAYNRPAPGNSWTPWDKSLKGQWQSVRDWRVQAESGDIRHSAGIWADSAIEYLQRKHEKPFLMYVGFTSPHDPRQAPKEFVDRYPAGRVQVPPNYLPEHPFDQGDGRVRDEVLAPFPRTRAAVQVHRSEYYAHITYMDSQIGRILDVLEKSPEGTNTYVIFTADHGLAVGQHGLMGKQNLYDHSVRMPYLITGPGIPKGRRVDSLMYQHSTFATACELARIPVPASVEFPSAMGLIHKKAPGPDSVFCWYRGFQRSVRTSRYKLIVYPKAGMTQLFDLAKDPWETTNLSGQTAHASVERELWERLRQHQRELGDPLALAPSH